ncbi:MAG: rpLL [Chlamydiales bacterium]|nr:rpLL [Chlamydiales bacterium]
MNKEALVEELSKLTVLEMSELKTALEEKWGVKAAAAVAMAAAPAAGAAAPAIEESTDFQVILSGCADDKKIGVIKAIREITGLGLKEAKDLVEEAAKGTAKVVKESAPKDEANKLSKQLQDAGAKVTLKGL